MVLNILTFLTNMVKLLNWPRYIGPLVTIALIAVNQALIVSGLFPVQVAWLYLPVAFSALTGLRAGLASAVMVATYSVWLGPTDPQRTVIIPLSVLLLAAGVGLQSRSLRRSLMETRAALLEASDQHRRADENQDKANFVDTLNGNILKVIEVIEIIDLAIDESRLAGKPVLTNRLIDTRLILADLATRAKGWHALAKERGFVLGEDD